MKTRSIGVYLVCLFTLSWTTSQGPSADGAEPQAVTYQQVLDYLKLEVKEEKIVNLVQQSPTVFMLGDSQTQELKLAGASDQLLAAMKKSGQSSVEPFSDVRDLVLILDCSGSMKDEVEPGVSKFKAAQKAAIDLVNSLPDKRRLALIVYGHDLARRCQAIDLVRDLSPVDQLSKEEVAAIVLKLRPAADTPIAGSLRMARSVLQVTQDLAKVVLITDGMESCNGDPVGEAALLAALPHVKGGVDVVGFGLSRNEVAAVERISQAGRGTFYGANSIEGLQNSLASAGEALGASLPQEAEPQLSPLDRLLIKQIGDADVNVRLKAVKAIGERNLKAAIPALTSLMSNDTWDYGAAQGVLGANTSTDGSKDEALKVVLAMDRRAAEQALITGLDSKDYRVAAWSAHHIGENQMRTAYPELMRVLSSERWELAPAGVLGYETYLLDAQKVISLAVLKKGNPSAAEQALFKAAESQEHKVREWATEMLTRLATQPK